MTYQVGVNVEERAAFLFQPDPAITIQYFDTLRRKTVIEPEKRLMLAVLEDAIMSLQKYALGKSRREKLLFREAEEWILESGSEWPFSFENICDALGLSPDYIRYGLARLRQGARAETPEAGYRKGRETMRKSRRGVKLKIAVA